MRLRDRVDALAATTPTEDERGNTTLTWDWANARTEPASVGPLGSSEYTSGQQTVITRWRVILLPGTSCTATSRVRWRGDTYEVDGDVELHTDHRGRAHHCEALLKRVEG